MGHSGWQTFSAAWLTTKPATWAAPLDGVPAWQAGRAPVSTLPPAGPF